MQILGKKTIKTIADFSCESFLSSDINLFPGETEPGSVQDTTPRPRPQQLINTQPSQQPEEQQKEDYSQEEDHKLLIAIAYKVQQLDSKNEKIVKSLKQNNRYLHSILRHLKALLAEKDGEVHFNTDN